MRRDWTGRPAAKETVMPLPVNAIMLGVRDLDRAKKSYGEGLGVTIDQD
jgi:hypothetical protein